MKQTPMYEYLGTNGTICSPVFLEGIYCIKKVRLDAEGGKQLTKDRKNFVSSIIVPENEVVLWKEV